jgi:molecular chaperone HscB
MDPFSSLGIPPTFDVDLAAAERAHRDLSRALHPDRFVNATASERRAALAKAIEVNEAWRVVRDPIRRAEALLRLAGVAVGENDEPPADPEFLMEMLEQREALAEARDARDVGRIREIACSVEALARDVERVLAEGFGRIGLAPGETADGRAAASGAATVLVGNVGKLRFFRRLLDEVSAIEDELAA